MEHFSPKLKKVIMFEEGIWKTLATKKKRKKICPKEISYISLKLFSSHFMTTAD